MTGSGSQDTKTFRNLSGYWEYDGPFSVELTSDADTSIVLEGVEIRDNIIVHVHSGKVKQTMGGIQLYSGGSPIYWRYSHIKVVRDGNGNLLWVNYSYR